MWTELRISDHQNPLVNNQKALIFQSMYNKRALGRLISNPNAIHSVIHSHLPVPNA